MPELPDVEGFRRYWSRYMTGERVRRVEVPTPAIVRNRQVAGFRRSLGGRRFERPDRHGKWMIAPTVSSSARWDGMRPTSTPRTWTRF